LKPVVFPRQDQGDFSPLYDGVTSIPKQILCKDLLELWYKNIAQSFSTKLTKIKSWVCWGYYLLI